MDEKVINLTDLKPGNLILVRMPSIIGKLIVIGQKIRDWNSPYAKWNHIAVIVSESGDLIEAHAKGIKRNTIQYYMQQGHQVQTINIEADESMRQNMVAFCEQSLRDSYGFVSIVCILFEIIFNSPFLFRAANTLICSSLAARCLEKSKYIFDDPFSVKPMDIAKMFDIKEGSGKER